MTQSAQSTLFGFPAQFDLGNLTVGLATLFLALVSIGIAIRSNHVSKKQKIAEFRKEWIENLRTAFSQYLTLYYKILVVSRELNSTRMDKYSQETKVAEAMYFETMEKFADRQNYIKLMLNPDEAEHQKALRKMSSISQRARRLFADPRAHFDADDTTSSDKLDLIARSILKKEWDRLRREI